MSDAASAPSGPIFICDSASTHDIAFLELVRHQVRERLRERGHDPGIVLIDQKDAMIEIKTKDGSSIEELLGYGPIEPPKLEEIRPLNRQERRAAKRGKYRGG